MPKEERDLTRVEKHTVSEKQKKKKKTGTQRGKDGNIWSRQWGPVSQITSSEPHQQALIKYTCIAAQGSGKKRKRKGEREEGRYYR